MCSFKVLELLILLVFLGLNCASLVGSQHVVDLFALVPVTLSILGQENVGVKNVVELAFGDLSVLDHGFQDSTFDFVVDEGALVFGKCLTIGLHANFVTRVFFKQNVLELR